MRTAKQIGMSGLRFVRRGQHRDRSRGRLMGAIFGRVCMWALAVVPLAVAVAGRFPVGDTGGVAHLTHLASNFASQAFISAGVVLVVALAVRFWVCSSLCLLGLILAGASLSSVPRQDIGGSVVHDDEIAVRVLHWNVRHKNRDAEALLALIEEVDADIAIFVEPFANLHALLARDKQVASRYPHRVVPRNVGHGMRTIVSRYQISSVGGAPLPDRAVGPMPVVATIGRTPVGIAVLHPISPRTPESAAEGRRALADEARELSGVFGRHLPLLISADLNGGPVSSRARRLYGELGVMPSKPRFRLAGTWPSETPRMLRVPIDDVWTRGHWRVVGWRTVEMPSSDHAAVVVDLVLRQGG